MKRLLIGLLIGVFLTVIIFYLLFFKYKIKVPVEEITLEKCPSDNSGHITDLPKEYFDINRLESYNDFVTSFVTISDLPTENISLTNFSNSKMKVKDIPKSFPGFEPQYEEPTDLDGDGVEEQILINTEAMTHRPHSVYIIKNNEVIFRVFDVPDLGFVASPSQNGFYITTRINDDGICCDLGYRKIRFIYENGEFKPVWEQKIYYLKIKNEKH